MATKEVKSPKKRDLEKRSAKRSDDMSNTDQKDTVTSQEEPENSTNDDIIDKEVVIQKESIPEQVYDEPTLSELIIESYEGDKARGLFEGEGTAKFAGNHVYKGEFSEGFMHGKGHYTWSDGTMYEGEFVRNHIYGKGTYYWPDGSTYEGEVVDGKRHGNGTFRCKENAMSYTGYWCMGKRHGKGKVDYDKEGNSYYEGDLVNNLRHGWGTRQYPSGNNYQGMWFNNVRHGEGTMKWQDQGQVYSGQWENGIKHGMGQHIWLLRRVPTSQYSMRNMYDGEFVNGLRHGYGTFYYANGARYEGGWKNNMKFGKGKFTFKNGRIYEGLFEKDHIVEYPEFTMDGTSSPDISLIRTRTPLPTENVSVHSNESKNTISPGFQLDIEHLIVEFTEADREEESSQALCVIMRHITSLRKIYNYYSGLGYEDSPDNTYIMNKMQFWRFLKDCRLHYLDMTLVEMDRVLGYYKAPFELHNPYERILQRAFINNLVVIAFHLYHKEHEEYEMTVPVLSWCLSKLINENILRFACNIGGNFYHETRRAVNALVYLDQTYEIYQSFCTPCKQPPKEASLKMRQFLYMMKDLKLINSDLTPKAILEVLSMEDPAVSDGEGCYNLELEMTFLEFFEALIGCAEEYVTEAVVKDPSTPRPSTALTQEQSMYSMPLSPSRIASQAGLDETESGAHASPHPRSGSPEETSPAQAVSSQEGTGKVDGLLSSKINEQHPSTSNVTAVSNGGQHGGNTSRRNSEKPEPQPILDQQKSSSFISTHTNATDENRLLMQSSISIGGQTLGEQSEHPEDEITHGEADEVEEELDPETRQFNFWTHQIHIFFVRKFFPAAVKNSELKQLAEHKING